MTAAPVAKERPMREVERAPEPVRVEAEPVAAAPFPQPRQAEVAAPAYVAPVYVAPVSAYAPAPTNLKETVEKVGLQWVETDPTKVAAVVESASAEPSAPRPRRERRPRPSELSEPLMQVETKKD